MKKEEKKTSEFTKYFVSICIFIIGAGIATMLGIYVGTAQDSFIAVLKIILFVIVFCMSVEIVMWIKNNITDRFL